MDFEVVDQDGELARSRIGDVINGKWKLVHLLGCGGMAAVFAADGPDGQRVALKMLHPQMNKMRDIRERFLREGTIANQVGHPGVVRVLEQTSKDDPTAVLVMELLEGEPLSDVLRRSGGRVPVSMLLDYLDQLLDVLGAAHDVGIIHRDLKPDNLFVTRAGILKVLDFGIARVRDGLSDDQRTRTGVLLGTMPFMSPEQALGKRDQVDGRTDLFAAGAIAFYGMAGRYVHEGRGEGELLIAMATKPATPLQSVVPTAPPELCAIVDQALAFSKEARYPDARTMQVDVRALREGRSPPYASREASKRSQGTQPFIVTPVVVPAVASARPANPAIAASAFPSTSARTAASTTPTRSPGTVVGPAPDAVTRLSDSLSHATRVGPSPDGVTALRGTPPQVTVLGPKPDALTRSSGSVSQETVVGPGPDAVTRVSGSLPQATVVGPTPDGVTRLSKPLPHTSSLGGAALGAMAASSSVPSRSGNQAEASSAATGAAPAASPVEGRKTPVWKRNAALALGLVLAVAALVYLFGGQDSANGEPGAHGAAGEPAIASTDTQPAAETENQAQPRAQDIAKEQRKRGRGKKH